MFGDVALASIISSALTTGVGWLTLRTSRRANDQTQDVRLSEEARQWVTAAQNEAKAAREEAAEARREIGQVRRENAAVSDAAADATRQMRDAQASFEQVVRWVARVVNLAARVHVDDAASPDVRRLVEAINGGPPGLTSGDLAGRLPPNP